MKKIALGSAVVFFTVLVQAQSSKGTPVGVWRGVANGLPTATLTLADDSGEISGTVVFYAIDGESRRVFSVEPHSLLIPKLEGSILTFQMKLGGDRAGMARVRVAFGPDNKAMIHCLDCGPDSPTVELIRQTE